MKRTRYTSKILPSNRSSCFSGLRYRRIREHLEADQPFPERGTEAYPFEGHFLYINALEWEDGQTELYLTDDDDMDYLLDAGQPYEVYFKAIQSLVFIPQEPGTYVPEFCPVTGEREWPEVIEYDNS